VDNTNMGARFTLSIEDAPNSFTICEQAFTQNYPCNVLTPIPSLRAFIACTAAIAPAAVVK